MATAQAWKSLIRFKDANGQVQFGEPDEDLKTATILQGSDILNLNKTTDVAQVQEVLAPFIPDTILCIGLNYKEHAAESGVGLSLVIVSDTHALRSSYRSFNYPNIPFYFTSQRTVSLAHFRQLNSTLMPAKSTTRTSFASLSQKMQKI